ncbi:hypothetical protein Mspyr1_54710 (plasmid) [Mycolicibacterium gilvum Spyr1]|uniref:Uncharacterized protein n=1 Tax=Mycolicibacterium gilvum (strain DSM 45189 / LMG 24558 / Spyr1) TaxID=278137 RepID=E6TQ59_MYCSR|nr:hypothetical protein Mspyr1_54710 [Mycolicibacterium gilvum Spyr1]
MLITHSSPDRPRPSSRPIDGSAIATAVSSSRTRNDATATTESTHHCRLTTAVGPIPWVAMFIGSPSIASPAGVWSLARLPADHRVPKGL